MGGKIYTECVYILIILGRLWVTDPHSPSSSAAQTPSHSAGHLPLSTNQRPTSSSSNKAFPFFSSHAPSSQIDTTTTMITPMQAPNFSTPQLPTPPQPYAMAAPLSHSSPAAGIPLALAPSVPASSLPGSRLSGGLVGVISLTDVLNMYARASGLSPADPAESRSRRRRSSSSSLGFRRSGEIGREVFGRGG